MVLNQYDKLWKSHQKTYKSRILQFLLVLRISTNHLFPIFANVVSEIVLSDITHIMITVHLIEKKIAIYIDHTHPDCSSIDI